MRHGHMIRKFLIVTGQVQGVGFRPFVYRWASDCQLTGNVGNTPEGVRIEVQGPEAALDRFEQEFTRQLPPLAKITSTRSGVQPVVEGETDFTIVMSRDGAHKGHAVLVSPDMAVCDSCLAETLEPGNRRRGYAFTNCTDCGPRYSITRSIPYDRPVTSMACFPLCERCSREYHDPLDRRFHAQPNACPECGPEVWLEYPGAPPDQRPPFGNDSGAAVLGLLDALRQGSIAAVKGLGGFHLVCDALNIEAVAALRLRKNRPHKALAVMVPDLVQARRFAEINPEAEKLLLSPERPIVICHRLPETGGDRSRLPALLSPDTNDIGLVLPYTPLHHLLFHPDVLANPEKKDVTPLPALVMTSGNAGGEPICLGNREAKTRLQEIADIFLLHNRDILVRVDDSVVLAGCEPRPGMPFPSIVLRRARGYVPSAQLLPSCGAATCPSALFAAGAEMKHTFCLTRGREAFVSQHIGHLGQAPSLEFFEETLAHLSGLLETDPVAVIRDLHPDYLSSRLAEEFAERRGIPVLSLQHHFAHVYAVMAEHDVTEPILGLALDGSGLGDDGTIWGGELLLATPGLASPGSRLGRLRPFPLPSGEAAIRSPWRIAEALAHVAGLADLSRPWAELPGHGRTADMLREMIDRGVQCPLTSSCGRLFDALAALCGVCFDITYEGQAAIRLEQILDPSETGSYALPKRTESVPGAVLDSLDTYALFRQAAHDVAKGVSVGVVSARFHRGLSRGLAEWLRTASEATGIRRAVLSGGCLNNRTLAAELNKELDRIGLECLFARNVPPGDGGISLGQAYWGHARLCNT